MHLLSLVLFGMLMFLNVDLCLLKRSLNSFFVFQCNVSFDPSIFCVTVLRSDFPMWFECLREWWVIPHSISLPISFLGSLVLPCRVRVCVHSHCSLGLLGMVVLHH